MQPLTYPIVETFHSVQGEGAWMGVNAFFIRLAGCDVHCPWCDTKESWNASRHPDIPLPNLVTAATQAHPKIVVITGGEPLMHDLTPLTLALKSAGHRVHLETSGAHPFSGYLDWVTFSPKPYLPPHESIYAQVNELKVVIATAEDLQWAIKESAKLKPEVLRYLQPQWDHPTSQAVVFDYVLQHPEWRVSLQTHKLMGVR